MALTADSGFDAAVVDRENRVVAVVQVKGHPIDQSWTSFLPGQLKKSATKVDFVLAIDPARIHLFQWNGSDLIGPIVDLDTTAILQHYEPEFGKRRVFEAYLVTLVEAWLRDLAYHWKSITPPGAEELRKTELLDKLAGGTTLSLQRGDGLRRGFVDHICIDGTLAECPAESTPAAAAAAAGACDRGCSG